jgi:hypothetical protein
MKKIIRILACVILISSYSNAFCQDVGVILYDNISNNQVFYPGDSLVALVQANNLGSTVIATTDFDSLPITLYANGKGVAGAFFAQTWAVNQIFIVTLSPMIWGNHNIDSGVVSMCAKTFIWKGGTNIDVNQNNDELCVPNVIFIGPPGTGIIENGKLNARIYYYDSELTVLLPKEFHENIDLKISDISGRVVEHINLDYSMEGVKRLNLKHLTPGIYVALIQSEEAGSIGQKFVVE